MLTKSELNNKLYKCELFKGMSEQFMLHLEQKIEFECLPRYSVLYHCKEPANNVYILLEGLVKISNYCNEDPSREVIKSLQQPYNMFGTEGLLGSTQRHDCAQSMNFESTLARLSTFDFQELLKTYPLFRLRFLEIIGSRIQKAEKRLESLVFKDARARLVDFLKECADNGGWKVGYEMLVKHCLTQQDIANIIGTATESAIRLLSDFKKKEIILLKGKKITLLNMQLLHKIAQGF